MKIITELTQMKDRLDQARPLSDEIITALKDDFGLRYTYHSNALEGNTLSLLETKVVIEDGVTIGGKSVREHLEAINHTKALDLLYQYAKNQVAYSEKALLDFHYLILKSIDDDNAGRFRNTDVFISGSKHVPPPAHKVYEQIQEIGAWYINAIKALHPVEVAALLHYKLVNVHPFIDGNGRTARLIMNLELIKHGYPLAIIEKSDRLSYYEALQVADLTNEYTQFINLIGECLLRSFNTYFNRIDKK